MSSVVHTPDTPPPPPQAGAGAPHGLTHEQAATRRAEDGPNALPRPPRRTGWRILLEVAREPMFQLLVAAASIYGVIGDRAEALVLLSFLLVIVAITLVQELRTERVLEALHDMTSPRALVWRDGTRQRVAGVELVRDDLIELAEGDRVPADAQLLAANDLAIDESLLSGESLAVAKSVPGGTDAAASQVFAGTLVVAGQGVARVTATGARSRIGRIGAVLGAITSETTPLQRQTRQLVRWFSVVALVVSALVGALAVHARGDWLQGALAGITMAMSLLPQEFVLILSVFMAMGAWRLSQHRVLTRRSATIETLGAATVLCTDKTGTLTHNRMAIDTLVRIGDGGALHRWRVSDVALPAEFHDLLRHGVLASEREPFDPMERAFHALGTPHLAPIHHDWDLVHEYGLSPQWPVMSHVWQRGDGQPHVVAAKGAPEAVMRLCRLPPAQERALLDEAARLADEGRRVLAVATASWSGGDWPDAQHGFAFRPLGLVALADPLRDTVPQAVAECRRAGIRVLMITGDHPNTALAIARQAGIDPAGGVLLGSDVAALDDHALRRRVAGTAVYARVAPEQKLRIVQALQADGEVVAMTGDGVNDAPSLKAAHIGIAMGGRGTDVAREAASLVLLDDDFGTLVTAVRMGRRIYDNLRKAMRFVFAVHVPIAGLTLLPLLAGWPPMFSPMHIAFLEIVIDPVCSIVFEAEPAEPDVMDRPPRDPAAALFTPAAIGGNLALGAVVWFAVALFYMAMLHADVAEGSARAAAFLALLLSNFALIVALRQPASIGLHRGLVRSRALIGMAAATATMLLVVLAVEPLRRLFAFDWPSAGLALAALGVALGVLALLALVRRLQRPAPSPDAQAPSAQ